ncbi:MFS transporter [Tropheryma whipplei]|uniref:MFS transporter n=1 Tax=Tropheryma whipplei TaxID=2039 RepID=UPI001E4FAA49|nr:MFS transporter [Tropheryma whipplei]
MAGYVELFRWKSVTKVVVVQLFARFPIVIFPIALLLFVQKVGHSIFSAGIVLAVFSLAQAVFSPVIARFTTIWPHGNVLITCACIFSGIAISVSVLKVPFWLMTIMFALCGVVMPPTQSIMRTLYRHLVPLRLRSALFSVDTLLQELIWVVGPIFVTSVAVSLSPEVSMIFLGVVLLFSSIWLAFCKEIKNLKIPPARNVFGKVLKKPVVSAITVVSILFMGSCTAIELAVVATFRGGEGGHTSVAHLTGVVIAIWSLGSMLGGLAFGHKPIGRWSIPLRMLPFFVGVVVASLSNNVFWIAIWLFVCGLGLAPVVSASYSYVASVTNSAESPEAFGWIASGQLLGGSAFSALAGGIIDSNGAAWGFILSGAGAVAAALLAVPVNKLLPALPDRAPTAPIDLIL